jgi:uncharacterized protein with HEPN domain
VSRRDEQRIEDIIAAIDAISGYLEAGTLDDGLVFDACRMRLVEIGEAVKGVSTSVRDQLPAIPWKDVAGMRDRLAHRYFDTDHSIVRHTAEVDLPAMRSVLVEYLESGRDDPDTTDL